MNLRIVFHLTTLARAQAIPGDQLSLKENKNPGVMRFAEVYKKEAGMIIAAKYLSI